MWCPTGVCFRTYFIFTYINDLPNFSEKLMFFLFADDTNIYLESSDLSYLEKIMNKELEKLYDWFCINRLSLNVSKTNFVISHAVVTILINKQAIDKAK